MPRDVRLFERLLIATISVAFGSLLAPPAALAHTDFDYSVPTDGAAVGEPVSEITVAFTEAVTLVGPGFEVLDPQGNVLQPFAVTDDDTVFRLQLDPPLGGGVVGVKYEVAAADGHVLGGSFTFTVTADAPVVTEPPVTDPPATEPPATTPPATAPPATTAPGAQATTSVAPPTTVASSTTNAPAVTTAVRADGSADDGSGSSIVLIGAAIVVAGAVGFLLLRLRRPPAS